jgi:hypothetical protein
MLENKGPITIGPYSRRYEIVARYYINYRQFR